MDATEIVFEHCKPDLSLSDFVESYWLLHNRSGRDKEVVVLPDGRIDLIFSQSPDAGFHISLMGIATQPDYVVLKADTLMFCVSFKLPAAEYILNSPVQEVLDGALILPDDFWGFGPGDMSDFQLFCRKASRKIQALLPAKPDERKQLLFELLYASKGSLMIKALSENVHWSSRQINRYFNRQFGLSLKSYCSILRFRASFQHIKEGKLFPQENFADQSHFIREVKKLSGVAPKDLSRNRNDRFIQLSTLKKP